MIATLPSKLFDVVDTVAISPLCLPAGSDDVSVCGRSLFIDVLFLYSIHFAPALARIPSSFASTRFCSTTLHVPPSTSRPSSLFVMQLQNTRPPVERLKSRPSSAI